MNKILKYVVTGISINVVIILWVLFWAFVMPDYEDNLISQCEETLPRNQHCRLVAIPETVIIENNNIGI
jgi:nitrogen fixation-related uncharacterized protein